MVGWNSKFDEVRYLLPNNPPCPSNISPSSNQNSSSLSLARTYVPGYYITVPKGCEPCSNFLGIFGWTATYHGRQWVSGRTSYLSTLRFGKIRRKISCYSTCLLSWRTVGLVWGAKLPDLLISHGTPPCSRGSLLSEQSCLRFAVLIDFIPRQIVAHDVFCFCVGRPGKYLHQQRPLWYCLH